MRLSASRPPVPLPIILLWASLYPLGPQKLGGCPEEGNEEDGLSSCGRTFWKTAQTLGKLRLRQRPIAMISRSVPWLGTISGPHQTDSLCPSSVGLYPLLCAFIQRDCPAAIHSHLPWGCSGVREAFVPASSVEGPP